MKLGTEPGPPNPALSGGRREKGKGGRKKEIKEGGGVDLTVKRNTNDGRGASSLTC